MSSQLRSAAARTNGAKSQGPVTPEGRARSSQNALRHGLSSAQVVIPGENPAEFEELRASYVERFQPVGRPEMDLAETMAVARWRLRRIYTIETELLSREQLDMETAIEGALSAGVDFNSHLASAFDSMANTGKTEALLIRYERHLTRTYESARKELQILQKTKQAPAPASDLQKVQNEPKPEPVPAPTPHPVRQNSPAAAPPAAPTAEVAPSLPHAAPQVGAYPA
ncbi:MAG TPA: hypothetical protein VN841_23845 [Bryobacteraceae bacterium]|nr:hypothetical protein [Bryobacteraceae bacterium]